MNNKLQSHSTKCVFLGYSATSKGYRCYDTKTGRVYVNRHVLFQEVEFPFQGPAAIVSELPTVPVLGYDPSSIFPVMNNPLQSSST